ALEQLSHEDGVLGQFKRLFDRRRRWHLPRCRGTPRKSPVFFLGASADLARVIAGYDYRTKDKLKHVEGLPGDFAYLRVARIAPGRVLTRLAHEHVWVALQLMHLDRLSAAPPASKIWQAGDDEESLLYLPRADAPTLAALALLRPGSRTTTLYAWQPELVTQHAPAGASVRPIPQFLLERFGIKS
ncbi:MAG: hypothetical protein Q7S40_08455, partial [Opitutaceae bacterium]|nr:hypothetical protein [Opitutaceae bacterium]